MVLYDMCDGGGVTHLHGSVHLLQIELAHDLNANDVRDDTRDGGSSTSFLG